MLDFWSEILKFFNSDFGKNTKTTNAFLIIVTAIITASILFFIFNKVVIPIKLREAGDFEKKYQNAMAENEELKSEIKNYKNIQNMMEALNSENSDMENIKGLDIFLNKP